MAWTKPALEKKFKQILTKYGQNVYLRRRCISCSQSAPYADYDDNCPVCSGKGFNQVLERYTMRKMVVGSQSAFPAGMQMTDTGPKLDEGVYFFCEAEVKPKVGDLIYDLNNATQEQEAYQINKVLERRYNDSVLFYNCAGEIKKDIRHI
jgi:hypothetical protein